MMSRQHKKDVNHYMRLSLISRIRNYVFQALQPNVPLALDPPIVFSYLGGRRDIVSVEWYQYFSQFKRTFNTIRCKISDGSHVPLDKLRIKHLTELQKIIPR